LFVDSFVKSLDLYQAQLAAIRTKKSLNLPDTNFDTGQPSKSGDYRLADAAAEKLLVKLEEHKFVGMDADLRKDLLAYYGKAGPAEPKAAMAFKELQAAAL
jgi:hypothetical protein